MPDWTEIVIRLGFAAGMGAIIGLDRNLHGKPTGLRTLSLVGLAAATMVLLAADHTGADAASRVLQGLLTGVGFLGAGVILHDGPGHKVHGLTTAAAILMTVCLGAACGLGAWRVALASFAIVGLILIAGGPVEKALHRRFYRKPPAEDAEE